MSDFVKYVVKLLGKGCPLWASVDIHCFANGEKNGASFRESFRRRNWRSVVYPSDLANTKTTIPLRVSEEQWIYNSTLRVSVYILHYSPTLRGIVVYYFSKSSRTVICI